MSVTTLRIVSPPNRAEQQPATNAFPISPRPTDSEALSELGHLSLLRPMRERDAYAELDRLALLKEGDATCGPFRRWL